MVAAPGAAPLASILLECLRTSVSTVAIPPATVSLRTGLQMEPLLARLRDECCEGVAWVRIDLVYPTSTFPEQVATFDRCGPLLRAAILELGVLRCAPRGQDENSIPTADEWDTAAELVDADREAILAAVCCFLDLEKDRMVVEGAWIPWPIEGGCMGGTVQLIVEVDACEC